MVENNIKAYLIGIIAFTFIIVSGISLISEFSKDNSAIMTHPKVVGLNSSFNKLNDITSYSSVVIQNNIEHTTDSNFGLFGVLNDLIATSWNGIKLTISSLSFMNDVWLASNTLFGVPIWVISLITAMITIIIGYSIYALVFQRGA